MLPTGKDFEEKQQLAVSQLDEIAARPGEDKFGGRGASDSQAHVMIGKKLKQVYGQLVEEPVPDHLLQLLEELERKEKGSSKA